jgi:drug/metabolite transporter (DMT)-like permease
MVARPLPVATRAPPFDPLRLRSAGLVLLAGALWSTGGVLVRLVETADARQIVLWRSLFVGLFVAGVLLARRGGSLTAGLRAAGWNAVVGGVCLAGAFLCFVEALTRTTVANAVFLLAAQPLLAALFGRLLLGERVRGVTWLAMLVAAAGVAVMMVPGLVLGSLAGSLLALASAAWFALFSVGLRHAGAADASPAILHGALISALLCVALLVPARGAAALLLTPSDIFLCAVMGVGQIGCGMLAFTAGARHLRAAELALLAQGEVVLGPVWAWLVLGEVPPATTLLGGVLVLAAVAWQALGGAEAARDVRPGAAATEESGS